MALEARTTKKLTWTAWTVMCVAGAMLIGIKIGSPLSYSDGSEAVASNRLEGASVVRWNSPEPDLELPGELTGRVARLADGRFIYGVITEDGTSDLVTWHPEHPDAAPAPAYGLNSEHNELAPAVTPDGRIYFASDRPGSAGGYDLYVSTWSARGFGRVDPVSDCNSEFDETDPAPDPKGEALVFVRIDRSLDNGNDGTLWNWRINESRDPTRVFSSELQHYNGIIDRDPAFSNDGAALWFVRKEQGKGLTVCRSSRLGEAFSAPTVPSSEWQCSAMRSPLPLRDGKTLGMLQPQVGDQAARWHISKSEELTPWWPDQHWLDWLLLCAISCSLLLLGWICFGQRWIAIDSVAQCMLLSVLLHALLFLWCMSVAIRGNVLPDRTTDDSDKQITVVTTNSASITPAVANHKDVASMVQRTLRQRNFDVAVPASSLPRSTWSRKASRTAVLNSKNANRLQSTPDGAASLPQRAPKATRPLPTTSTITPIPTAPKYQDTATLQRQTPTPAPARTNDAQDMASSTNQLTLPTEPTIDSITAPSRSSITVKATTSVTPPSSNVKNATKDHARRKRSIRAVTNPKPRKSTPPAIPFPPAPANKMNALPAKAGREHAPRAALKATDIAIPDRPRTTGLTAKRAEQPERRLLPQQFWAIAPTSLYAPETHTKKHRLPARKLPQTTARDDASVSIRDPLPPPQQQWSNPPEPAHQSQPRPVIGRAKDLPETPTHHVPFAPRRDSDRGAKLGPIAPPKMDVMRQEPRRMTTPRSPQLATTDDAHNLRFRASKATALQRLGGTPKTEQAVHDGLAYLARIQNQDGSWGRPEVLNDKYGFTYIGKTSLCALAFLGAGHTPTSETEHSDVVKRAIDRLLEVQDAETGAFGSSSCYGHGITTYAIAECYGFTKSTPYGDTLLGPLSDSLTWILANQGPRRDLLNRGGWGYFSPGLQAEDSYARVSVSSWMIRALHSAILAGLELPGDVMPAAKQYLELSFDRQSGWFRYNNDPNRLQSAWPTLPASTPAGALCLMLLGTSSEDQMVSAAVDYTVARSPNNYTRHPDDDFVLGGQGNVYFWYYGSLCCFRKGGEAWDRWNAQLSTVLPEAQAEDGSFAPIDVYADEAGDNQRDRSYTTALCVLSLEVYYRYLTPLVLGR